VPVERPCKFKIDYRSGIDAAKVSDAELALICSVLPELMVELAAKAGEEGKEWYGSRAVRKGIDHKAG
jgi:hypothetical protein